MEAEFMVDTTPEERNLTVTETKIRDFILYYREKTQSAQIPAYALISRVVNVPEELVMAYVRKLEQDGLLDVSNKPEEDDDYY